MNTSNFAYQRVWNICCVYETIRMNGPFCSTFETESYGLFVASTLRYYIQSYYNFDLRYVSVKFRNQIGRVSQSYN